MTHRRGRNCDESSEDQIIKQTEGKLFTGARLCLTTWSSGDTSFNFQFGVPDSTSAGTIYLSSVGSANLREIADTITRHLATEDGRTTETTEIPRDETCGTCAYLRAQIGRKPRARLRRKDAPAREHWGAREPI